MDHLAAMRVFASVVETGGLSAAGRALGLAPSTVSRRVAELEDRLGVRLLQRTTRRLSLTEAGATYYERVRDIVRAVDEAGLAVTEQRAGPSGPLRVTVPASMARRHIAPAVADFVARYPTVNIAMSVTDRTVDIVGEGFDVAVRTGRLDDSSLIARKLGQCRRLVGAAPAYLTRAGRPRDPKALAEHACLSFRRHPGGNIWRFRSREGRTEVRVSGPFVADDGEALVAAASAGLGLILVPEWLVGDEIAAGRLVEVLTDHAAEPAETPIYAVYAPGPHVPPNVRAFVGFLAERFGRDYAWGGGAFGNPVM